MALVIDLKPHEKILVGNTTITNDKQRTKLRIDGTAPILREKDTMTVEGATTPSKKLYFNIQTMYLSPSDQALDGLDDYFTHIQTIAAMAPHVAPILNTISKLVLMGTFYKGLKLVQELMNSEESGDAPTLPPELELAPASASNTMEARMLNQAADQLQDLSDTLETKQKDEIEATINYNRKLWMVFFDGMDDKNTTPDLSVNGNDFDIQNNIVNLYQSIYKRSKDIIETPSKDKIKILIDINRTTSNALLS